MSKLQRLTIVLTAFNLILLGFGLARCVRRLRKRFLRYFALAHWKSSMTRAVCRAEIKVLPAQPALKMPDGTTGYPETVQLRLISSQGSPHVKLVTTEDGSGLGTRRRKGIHPIAVAGHGSLHQDRDEGRSGADDQTVTMFPFARRLTNV